MRLRLKPNPHSHANLWQADIRAWQRVVRELGRACGACGEVAVIEKELVSVRSFAVRNSAGAVARIVHAGEVDSMPKAVDSMPKAVNK